MLNLQAYLSKAFEVQWYFNENDLNDLESLLFVRFERKNDYYVINKLQYTYLDLLLGLEDMEFEMVATLPALLTQSQHYPNILFQSVLKYIETISSF